MKRLPILTLLLTLLAVTTTTRADLAGDIRPVLGDKLLRRGEVSIAVARLHDGNATVVYEFKPNTPRIPASNLKLITTAAALEHFGPDFEFKTVLAGRGKDLALVGDGDPTFGDAELLKKVGWEIDTVFKRWADLLKSRGISEIDDVLVDDSIFDEEFVHASWPVEQQHKRYVAQVAGVNLNANCADFYLTIAGAGQPVSYRMEPPTRYLTVGNTCVTGSRNAIWLSRQLNTNNVVLRGETNASNTEPVSVTVHDPPMYAGAVLCETLQAAGIKVNGQVRRDRTIRATLSSAPATQPESRWAPLAIHTTPISAVLNRANKDSMNLYAEALCKRLGAAVSGESGSWANGTAAISKFLTSLGVSPDEVLLDDGCGLSKKNAISANALMKVLAHEFAGRNRETFMSSLAVAGSDGTFENRFRDSSLQGRVFGKSGYVSGVSSISGYLHARDGQWYVFSIIMNGLPEGTNYTAKQLQERIVGAIDAASAGSMAAGQ